MTQPLPHTTPPIDSRTTSPQPVRGWRRFLDVYYAFHRWAESGWSRSAVAGWGVLQGSVMPGPSDALLIPLGLVAFMFLVAGIAMFGFVAAATMTGAAITGGQNRDATANGAMLRAFVTGTAVYLVIWVIAAALSGVPLIGAMARSFASAITFVACTTGFGAVLLSWWRGDLKQERAAV